VSDPVEKVVARHAQKETGTSYTTALTFARQVKPGVQSGAGFVTRWKAATVAALSKEKPS
jgi:hypothetical protein